MRPVILFRPHDPLDDSEEKAMAQAGLTVIRRRTEVMPGDLVVGRYSVLPFYKELEDDVRAMGGQLINSYQQHRYIADLRNWTQDLAMYTPATWTRLEDLPDGCSFVLKGETNSKKELWHTHMFAQDKKAAVQVWLRLKEDALIGSQEIMIREYVPLVTLAHGINGQPITKEFRFFVLDGKILTGAFYWSSHVGDLEEQGIEIPLHNEVPRHEFLYNVIDRVMHRARFLAIDVAQLQDGSWTVVELNDGQMSGLSSNDPYALYKHLHVMLGGPL